MKEFNSSAVHRRSTQKETHLDRVQIDVGDDPVRALHCLPMDREREVLGHDAVRVDDFDARRFEVRGEEPQRVVAVELGAVQQAARPREDRRDGVRARLVALLVLAVVARDSTYMQAGVSRSAHLHESREYDVVRTVRRLALNDLAVRREELTCHHSQGTEALREDITLHVAIVVLGRPYEAASRLDGLRDHVVDQAMLIVDAELLERGLVLAT